MSQLVVGKSSQPTSERSAEATTATAEEALEHLLGRHLLIPPAAGRGAWSPLREPAKGALCLCLAEPRVRIGAEAVELVPLLLVAQHAKGATDHLEGLVGMLVAVLVGVRQEGLLAIGLLDLALGACLLDLFEAQDLVERGGRASADPDDGSLLLDRVGAGLVTLVVVAVASSTAGVGARS